MKKIFERIKEVRQIINSLQIKEIGKKKYLLTVFSSIIFVVICLVPIILVIIELFKQYSSITPLYYVLLVFVFILSYLVVPFYMIIFYEVLKNNIENEQLNSLKSKDIFVSELFNLTYLIFGIIVTLGIYLVVG